MNAINPNEWGPCPQGEWQRLAAGLSFRKWLLLARNGVVALLAATALGGGAWVAAGQFARTPATNEVQCCPPAVPCEPGKSDDCGKEPCPKP